MRSLLTFILCLFSVAAFSGVIVVDKNLPYQNQGKSISYFKDVSANLSLNAVIKADKEGRWLKSGTDILNLGNSRAAYWLKLSYINKSKEKIYLIIDAANIEDINLYTEHGKGKYNRIHSGSIAAPNTAVIADNNFIFDLNESADTAKMETVYLRLKSNSNLLVPVKIGVSKTLISGVNATERFESVYIGILLTIFFFNISVFIKSKDNTYLYYSIYIVAMFVFIVFYFRGYGYVFGVPVRHFINHYPHLFLSTGIIASIAFSFRFLNLKVVLPWAKRYITVLICGWLLVTACSLLGLKTICANLSQLLAALTMITIWFLGVKAYRKGVKAALYFIIAKVFLCITSLWMVLNVINIFPYTELSFQLVPIGFIFELLMLSLALGDRLKDMKRHRLAVQSDQLKMQKENLYLVNSQNERLEKVVESRTRALKKIVQSLEAANADKNRLFSIIAHDLRSPFNSLISLLSLNDMDLLTFEDVKMLLNDSRKNIDNIHNTLNNLLYWAQSQMQGITTAPSRFNVRIVVEDLMLVYQPLLSKKNIKIEIVVDDDADVIADLNQISLVLRNLIDNAIKFTPLNNYIHIRIWGSTAYIFIDVCNPVAGALNLDKLTNKEGHQPSYGTSNERGVGLGLHLCRDFIEKNNGQLKVSKENDCVVLRFNLPKFQNYESSFPAQEKEEEHVPV